MCFQLEAVNTDYEKMLKSNNRLQKIALTLEDEKSFLQNEVDRLTKELESRFQKLEIFLFNIIFGALGPSFFTLLSVVVLCWVGNERCTFCFCIFRELTNRINEDRCSQMLDECLTIKEELNRERLDKELLEQNRSEAESLLAYLEKAKGYQLQFL